MLKYIGNGFIPGIPAKDLNREQVKKYGGVKFLLETGLFEKVKPKRKIKVKVVKKTIEEGE